MATANSGFNIRIVHAICQTKMHMRAPFIFNLFHFSFDLAHYADMMSSLKKLLQITSHFTLPLRGV